MGAALPATTPFGLRTYPGGTVLDGGCSTGLLRTPIAPPNLSEVDALIRSLQADGGTPTAAALKQAAQDVRATGATSATMVLVSDGLSNCGPDPCQVTREIEASGIDVTVNTVGFRLSNEGRAQLQCIASAAHGRYQDVDNTDELVDELNRLARPLLEVRLRYPPSVKAVTGENATGLVNVVADITAVGARQTLDAQATMSFTVEGAPAVLSPRRRLGNLASGSVSTVTWQFRPPLEDASRSLTFQVNARGANSPPAVANGSISLDASVALGDAGPLLKDKKRIAILGDSYSAGEGGEQYLPGTDTDTNGCHRSPNTYGVSLFGALRSQDPETIKAGLARPDGNVDLFACSGALARDLVLANENNANELAQIDHLYQEQCDLALLTIGGNDIGFESIIKRCVLAVGISCPDEDVWQLVTGRTLREQAYADIQGLTPTLVDALRSVERALNYGPTRRARGRPAPLVVLGYPAPGSMGAGANSKLCSFAFDDKELAFFQEISLRLNAAIEAAVTEVKNEGRPVYFVPDIIDAFQPAHTYCASDAWIHKIDAAGLAGKLNDTVNQGLQVVTGTNRPFWQVVLTQGALVAIAGRLIGAAEKPAVVGHYKEQMHPTKRGYQAMTAMLVRWSASPAAQVPVTRTVPPELEVAPPSPTPNIHVSTVDVGRITSVGVLEANPGDTLTVQVGGVPAGLLRRTEGAVGATGARAGHDRRPRGSPAVRARPAFTACRRARVDVVGHRSGRPTRPLRKEDAGAARVGLVGDRDRDRGRPAAARRNVPVASAPAGREPAAQCRATGGRRFQTGTVSAATTPVATLPVATGSGHTPRAWPPTGWRPAISSAAGRSGCRASAPSSPRRSPSPRRSTRSRR